MADNFKLESELPGPQQATGQMSGGGSQGLLDVLSAIGSGLGTVGGAIGSGLLQTLQALPEVAAYRQAALGNVAPLQQIQEQRQQKQLQETLQATDFGEFTPRIQSALKMGGVKEAQKVATQIPVFKSISDLVKSSTLSSSDKEAVLSAGLVDPNRALDLYRSLAIIEKQQVGRQAVEAAKEQRELRREERKVTQLERKLPGNILASEFKKGTITAADMPGIIGILQARGVKIPGTPGEQQLWVRNLLANPELKQYIPAEEKKGFFDRMFNALRGQPQQAPAQPAAAATVPSLTPEQQRRLEELRRKRGQ